MQYNFDEIVDRRGTDALKWDGVPLRWNGRTDLLPMWVADMDFRTAPFVVDALRKRLEHEVLGYTMPCKEWSESIRRWCAARYGWHFEDDRLIFVPGIVRGIAAAIRCLTQVGDKVLVTPPVYHPFFLVTQNTGREVVYSPLTLRDGQYEMDFDRFRRDVQGCKIFLLSNPHNPGGKVWSKEELARIASICAESGTLVISDEIHADLVLPPYRHCTYNTVSEEARAHSIVFMSPSKAFNMAGLASSYGIVENEALRRRFFSYMQAGELSEGHLFAYIGTAAAYSHGTEWLDQMLSYVRDNVDYAEAFLRERIPAVGMIRPQASFLIMLDCRRLGLRQKELVSLFVDKARLALNDGAMFGKEGEGFMRLNVGCPRAVLQEALEQLERAVNGR